MGKRIRIQGTPEEHEENKRISELKQENGWPDTDTVMFNDGNGSHVLSDRDRVKDIPDEANVSTQVGKGVMFG
jgi:hypothetical protein